MKALALLLLLALALVPLLAHADERLTGQVAYDLTARKPVTGITYSLASIDTNALGIKGFTIRSYGLIGTTDTSGTFGGILAVRRSISDQHFAEIGLGGRVASGEKPHGYLYLGLGTRF